MRPAARSAGHQVSDPAVWPRRQRKGIPRSIGTLLRQKADQFLVPSCACCILKAAAHCPRRRISQSRPCLLSYRLMQVLPLQVQELLPIGSTGSSAPSSLIAASSASGGQTRGSAIAKIAKGVAVIGSTREVDAASDSSIGVLESWRERAVDLGWIVMPGKPRAASGGHQRPTATGGIRKGSEDRPSRLRGTLVAARSGVPAQAIFNGVPGQRCPGRESSKGSGSSVQEWPGLLSRTLDPRFSRPREGASRTRFNRKCIQPLRGRRRVFPTHSIPLPTSHALVMAVRRPRHLCVH